MGAGTLSLWDTKLWSLPPWALGKGEQRSHQRGLSSTRGDSLSYCPVSGSVKEAGNDYGAYGGARVAERLQKPR